MSDDKEVLDAMERMVRAAAEKRREVSGLEIETVVVELKTKPDPLPKVPDGWADDQLSRYFEFGIQNRRVRFLEYRKEFEKLVKIDEVFLAIVERWRNPEYLVPCLLILKSHASFRAACEHAMAGQLGDVPTTSRACLEAALYAFHLSRNSDAEKLWLERNDDDASFRMARGELTISKMLKELRKDSPQVADIIDELYQETIELGAHPNIRSITTNLATADGFLGLTYMQQDPAHIRLFLQIVATAGFSALYLTQMAFPAQMVRLGIEVTELIPLIFDIQGLVPPEP